MKNKLNIFLVGPIGAGKTTIGKQLSNKLTNMEFFDTDQEIESRTGVDISWIFDIEGEKGFRKRETNIINELTKKKNIIISTGDSSVKSINIRNKLFSKGLVIYLNTSLEKQISSIKKNKHKQLFNNSKSYFKIIKLLKIKYVPLYKEIADLTIYTNEQNIKIITEQILNFL